MNWTGGKRTSGASAPHARSWIDASSRSGDRCAQGPPRSARRCATETLDSLQILFLESIVHMISMAFMSVARLPNRGISDVRGAHSSTSLRAR